MYFNPTGYDYTYGYVLAKGTDGKFGLVALSSIPSAVNDANNNSTVVIRNFDHTTSGVPGAGIGAGVGFRAENSVGTTVEAARVGGSLAVVTDGAEDGQLDFWTRAGGGALTRRWSVSKDGHLVGFADNTYDIGASGATRPRTLYVGTSIVTPTIGASAGQQHAPPAVASGTLDVIEAAQTISGVKTFTATPVMSKLATPNGVHTFATKVTITGPGTTATINDATIAATDIVVCTPNTDPASAGGANNIWAVINAGVSIVVTMQAAPVAPCTISVLIIRKP